MKTGLYYDFAKNRYYAYDPETNGEYLFDTKTAEAIDVTERNTINLMRHSGPISLGKLFGKDATILMRQASDTSFRVQHVITEYNLPFIFELFTNQFGHVQSDNPDWFSAFDPDDNDYVQFDPSAVITFA